MSESTGTASFLQELEEWYTWLDNALVLDALMRVASEESEHNQGTFYGAPDSGPLGDVVGRLFVETQELLTVEFSLRWSYTRTVLKL